MPLKTPLNYQIPAIANRRPDKRVFVNQTNGYTRVGMPERTKEQNEALIAAAEAKRARRAARYNKASS